MYPAAMVATETIDLRPTAVGVLGAGPKGIALAAKAAVLEELGLRVPTVTLVESNEVAANWTGKTGYTTGTQPLGTPPQKDVGYPYASTSWGPANKSVNYLMQRYSWQAYLVDLGRFSDWVDRGRPPPEHREWAEYLAWVARVADADVVVNAAVDEIDLEDGRWVLRAKDRAILACDALVITGPGEPKRVPTAGIQTRIFDGRSFWGHEAMFRAIKKPINVGVVGSGETAAAVAVELLGWVPRAKISFFSPQGVIYSRGESFQENRYFSHPENWQQFSVDHRREFVRRTDRGVFSQYAKTTLDVARNVEYLLGRVQKLVGADDRVLAHVPYGSQHTVHSFDYVIDAIGFDPLSFQKMFSAAARKAIHDKCTFNHDSPVEDVEPLIGPDLCVQGMAPPLHLPMLAAFQEGPGFPNLSALGLLSDRVLAPYCQPARQEDTDRVDSAT